MPLYENIFLARQDLSGKQLDGLVEHYKNIIVTHGGEVGRVENWGLKTLTHPIKKNQKAYYALMDLNAPAEAVSEMERQMKISEDILRFLTVRVQEHEKDPSAMMQKRDRDERSERPSFRRNDKEGVIDV